MKKTIVLAMIASFAALALGGDYIIIVNSGSSLAEVSKTELKRLYTGKMNDLGGNQVTAANLALDNPAAAAFLSDVVGMNSTDYKSFWMAQQIRGGSSAPAVRKTPDAMVEYVKESPAALGYVPAGTAVDGVKSLTVK